MKIIKSALALVMVMAWLLAPAAIAGEIVRCRYQKLAAMHRCVVRAGPNEAINVGDQAIAYQNELYWAGTGVIREVKGRFGLAVFKQAELALGKAMRVDILPSSASDQLDWSAAFSDPSQP